MQHRRRLVLCLALLLLAPPRTGHAQEGQEVQVPLDEAGRVQEVDRDLARRTGLFLDEYPDLRVVRLYRLSAARFVLEVTYEREGQRARRRVPLTAREVASLRARVTATLSSQAPDAVLNQEGRFLLLGGNTLLGLGYYGWAVPVMLDVDTGRGVVASYMLTAGASFVLPYLYTKTRPVTYGMANAGFWGSTRGILHGVYLANVLDDSPSGEFAVGLGLVASVGEGLAAYEWARRTDMSAGHAHTIGNFGDFGHTWAGTALFMLQPDNDQLSFAALLGGSVAGLVAGTRRARALPYSWGDAEVQRTAFFLGAGNGVAAFDLLRNDEFDDLDDNDGRLLGGLLLAGSTAGMILADRALVGREFTVSQGVLVELGTLAGGLLGLGTAALLGSEDADDTLFLTLGALGADLGFLATFASLADDAARRADSPDRFDLQVNPGALLLLRNERAHGPGPGGVRVPLVSARLKF